MSETRDTSKEKARDGEPNVKITILYQLTKGFLFHWKPSKPSTETVG